MSMMRVREGLELIRSSRGRRFLWQTVRQRFRSRRVSIALHRDMNLPFAHTPAKVPLVVRKLRPDDDLSCVAEVPGLDPRESQQRTDQRWLLDGVSSGGLPAPWVAIDPDGKVCFMTWLFTAHDNARVQAWWRGLLPELKPDAALFEGPFTAASHRGLRVMLDAGNQVVEAAKRDSGVRWVLGIIAEENAPSLKVAEQGAFVPFAKREESWFLFRRRIRYLPLAKTTK
jgi:hypothetical protein